MKLREDWQKIITKAWSIRFLILAGALSGGELCVSVYEPSFVSPGLFAALSGLLAMAAFVARIVAQKDFDKRG